MEPTPGIFGYSDKQKRRVVEQMTTRIYNLQRKFYRKADPRFYAQCIREIGEIRSTLYELRLGKTSTRAVADAINDVERTLVGWAKLKNQMALDVEAPSSEGYASRADSALEDFVVQQSDVADSDVLDELLVDGLDEETASKLIGTGKVADYLEIRSAMPFALARSSAVKLGTLCLRSGDFNTKKIANSMKNRCHDLSLSVEEHLEAAFGTVYGATENKGVYVPTVFDLTELGEGTGGGPVEPILAPTGRPAVDSAVAELKRRGDHLGRQVNEGDAPGLDVNDLQWKVGSLVGGQTGEVTREAVRLHLPKLFQIAWENGYRVVDGGVLVEGVLAQLVQVCVALHTTNRLTVSASGGGQSSSDAPRLYADQTAGVVIKNPSQQ